MCRDLRIVLIILLGFSMAQHTASAQTAATTQNASRTGSYSIESTPLDPQLYAQVQHRMVADVLRPGAYAPDPFPNKGRDGSHPENATDKTHYAVYVPEDYRPDKSWGLLVFMSPLDQTDVPGGWQAIVQRHRLLLIVPQDVGNEHFRDWRVALALKAYQIMNAAYKLNTARVYLVGSSGGGRASSEASICCSDVFTGAICNCGVNFLRVNGASPGEDNFDALPEFARLARERSRFYLFTGSGDGNRDETKAVAAWMKRWGFKNVTYFEQDGAGHADMSDENFEKGLVALDAPLAAEVPLKLKQAESFLKQNRPGQALALCQQAASVAPGTEECQKSQARFDELLKDYQRELAQTQAAVDAGDRVKANAAIAAFIRLYAPWSNDDVAALRKRLLPPHAAG